MSNNKIERSSYQIFLKHFRRNLMIGFLMTVLLLVIGMVGYHSFEKVTWLDAYTNAAMIISGVGTLTNPETSLGKLFVSTYSILGGATFLVVVAVVFTPIFHWFFRQMHIEERDHFK